VCWIEGEVKIHPPLSSQVIRLHDPMKHLRVLFALASFTMAIGSVSHAAVSTTGQADPTNISIGGSLDKYVNFTKIDTSINMGDLGGPQLINGHSHSPSIGTFPTGYGGYYGGSGADAAEITFDSNTHLRLDISAFPDLSTTDANGIVDTIPVGTWTEVKGRQVKSAGGSILTTNNANYSYGTETPLAQSFIFGHGPASGINLSLYYTRTGMDDHAGAYSTSATMTWSDLG
jgi:hypothetical protein